MSIRTLALAMTFSMATNLAAEEPDAQIAIRRDAHVVTVTGLTPGGRSAIIVSWKRDSAVAETWQSGTADATGMFSAAFPFDAPTGGLVAVADVESGRLQIDTGDGSFFRRVDLPEIRLKRN